MKRETCMHRRVPFLFGIAGVIVLGDPLSQAVEPNLIRVATFNVSLAADGTGELQRRLETPADHQVRAVAEIIQRVRPHVILLNEFDFDSDGRSWRLFQQNYLAHGQNQSASPGGPAQPIEFQHVFFTPVNTGCASGFDLDNDGRAVTQPGARGYAQDAWGYGNFPGQYGMLLLSQFPIDKQSARTFQRFLWRDMPGATWPDDPATPAPGDWYSDAEKQEFRLSSKSHWDIPITIGRRRLHLLASHPTPPVFDGPEDRNGCRNHDEIRFWADFLDPQRAAYVYDDQGQRGGLSIDQDFVIVGDLNCDPRDGDASARPLDQLWTNKQFAADKAPRSAGAQEQSSQQGGANLNHQGDPACDTAELIDTPGPGNLRLDYVLPSRNLKTGQSGVFWPASSDRLFDLVGVHPIVSSDHRLVWVDIELADREPRP